MNLRSNIFIVLLRNYMNYHVQMDCLYYLMSVKGKEEKLYLNK